MDFLKAEIDKKRKSQEQTAKKLGSKYIKRGDVERIQEEEYLRKQKEKQVKFLSSFIIFILTLVIILKNVLET